jgi:hypothetical protein
MSSSAVQTKFASTLLQLFPPFRWDETQEDVWMKRVMRGIAGFSDRVVETTLDHMIDTRTKDKGLPTVAECINACVETKRWVEKDQQTTALPVSHASLGAGVMFTDYRKRLAHELIVGPLGRQADKEGWIVTLRNWICEHGRLPRPGELSARIAEAKKFSAAYAQAVRNLAAGGPYTAMYKRIVEFGDDIMNDQKMLGAIARGEVRP